jgi:hypothetical protein
MITPGDGRLLLTTEQAAAACQEAGLPMSVSYLERLRRLGGGPPFVRTGRSVRYPAAALARFIDELSGRRRR